MALRQLLTELQLDRAGHRAPPLRLEGHALLRRARATAKRAPGCDGWAGKHWNRLPEQFFHSLAEVRPPAFAQPQRPIINESGQLDARVLALHRLEPDDHHGVEAQRTQGTPL